MNLIKGMLFSAVSLVAALGLRAATYYPVTIIYDPGDGKSIADFPVLVRIPSGSSIYATAGDGGANLRFTDSLGVNNYPHEVDTWNASGESLVWVKVPELKKDAVFRLYCSGDDTTAVKDVWPGYAGVWHLNAAVDSTEKDLDVDGETHTTKFFDGSVAISDAPVGTGRGQKAQGVGATFTSKVATNVSGKGVPIPAIISDATKVTFSCWARPTTAWTTWKTFVGPRASHNGNLGVTVAGANSLRVETQSTGSAWATYTLSADKGFAINSWMHFVFVFDKKSQQVYMNGELIGSSKDLSGDPLWNYAGWMGWGGNVSQTGGILADGAQAIDFDECRIYDGAVGAELVAADYATVMYPEFLAIGPATEEQDIPAGTVAQVGPDYYQNFSEAVAASKASGDPVILMANDQSWTFTFEGESVSIKLGSSTFSPVNGLGDGYYLDSEYDSQTEVTTFTLKKQVVVVAMRNVAVYKQLHTRDLAELLPPQVAGLDAYGEVVGMFDVVWDVEDITVYDHFGITPVPGIATVGGEQWPVTAYVRATLPYSDDYHNIAQEVTSLVVTAPAKGDYELIDDVSQVSEQSTALLTNGLPATAVSGSWIGAQVADFCNWKSNTKNPFVDVALSWGEKKKIYRIDVVARGGGNNDRPKTLVISADGETIADYLPTENANTRPKLNFFYSYDFATPIDAQNINVTIEQQPKEKNPNVAICEILIWSDGTPADKNEMSTSAELAKLSFDGRPVGLTSGVYKYTVPHAVEVTAFAGEANVAVTVLPEVNKIIRIVTLGEDGSSKIYTIRTGTGFNVILR